MRSGVSQRPGAKQVVRWRLAGWLAGGRAGEQAGGRAARRTPPHLEELANLFLERKEFSLRDGLVRRPVDFHERSHLLADDLLRRDILGKLRAQLAHERVHHGELELVRAAGGGGSPEAPTRRRAPPARGRRRRDALRADGGERR